jgi:transposase
VPRMSLATEASHSHIDSDGVVVGIDAHKDVHVEAVISVLSVLVSTHRFPTTVAGYQQLLS